MGIYNPLNHHANSANKPYHLTHLKLPSLQVKRSTNLSYLTQKPSSRTWPPCTTTWPPSFNAQAFFQQHLAYQSLQAKLLLVQVHLTTHDTPFIGFNTQMHTFYALAAQSCLSRFSSFRLATYQAHLTYSSWTWTKLHLPTLFTTYWSAMSFNFL